MNVSDVLSGSGSDTSSANRFQELTSEEFMKIMFTELTRQDPTDPQDTDKLMQQISSLRDIESDMQLMDRMSELVGQNEFAAASNLIGKGVVGKTEDALPVMGKVVGAGIENDEVILTLDSGERVPFKQIESVFEFEEESNA